VATILGSCGSLARHWRFQRSGGLDRTRVESEMSDLDGFDPSCALIGTDAPPFPPHLGGVAGSVDGGKQQSGDQCDAKNVKESHLETRNQVGGITGAER
jgi:hypothetical protein